MRMPSRESSLPDYDDAREIPGGLDSDTKEKRFKIREPSVLEKKIMADARQRQKDGITTTQVGVQCRIASCSSCVLMNTPCDVCDLCCRLYWDENIKALALLPHHQLWSS